MFQKLVIIPVILRPRLECYGILLQNHYQHVHCSSSRAPVILVSSVSLLLSTAGKIVANMFTVRSFDPVPILLYLVLRHQRQPFRVLASIVQKFPIVNVSINVTFNVSVTSLSPITLFSNPPPLLDLLSPCSSNITRICSLLLCFAKERNLEA